MLIDSAIISRGSGSLGGLTLSHNAGGMYLRARTIPTDPGSAAQVNARNALAVTVQRWIDVLTDVQREAWATYAANVTLTNPLGAAINVSGMNMYVRSNQPRIRVGLPFVDNGPTVFNLGAFTIPVPDFSGANKSWDVTFTPADEWANETGSSMIFMGGRDQNVTINFFKGPYRFAGRIDGDDTTAPTSPAVFDGQFFHSIGNKKFWQVRVSRTDGRLSSLIRGGSIVGA